MSQPETFDNQLKMQSLWAKFSLISVCALAVCVSLGAALVSISKALVLTAVLGNLLIEWRAKTLRWPSNQPWTIYSICIALAWMLLTFLWTEANLSEAITAMLRHSRLLWLLAIFYLLKNKKESFMVLKFLVLGQIFVVVCSSLMWLGVPIPWAKSLYPPELGIVFTSTLEQPIMSTLMLSLIWFYRQNFKNKWIQAMIWLTMLLTLSNVLFIMTGRTGYLVILLFIFIASYFMMPKRFRLLSIIAPVILGFILIVFPTRFQSRFNDVIIDVQNYQPSESEHGNASRIDYWYYSIKPFTEKPLLGNGVGSWRQNYKLAGGLDKNPPSNPHQQYLLWAVESGTVGLLMIIIIFVSLIKDAFELQKIERQALITVTAIAALTGLINCPFFGVGMGEFFLTIFAALLVQKKFLTPANDYAAMQLSSRSPNLRP